MKARILIVEYERIVYDKLRIGLISENFNVGGYSGNYEVVIDNILNFNPDLVLIDIALQGSKSGIDIGKLLNDKFNIPFIYLSDSDDDQIFYMGLSTCPAHFMTKNRVISNIKELVRAIQTILQNRRKQYVLVNQNGILCLPDYLENIKHFASNQVSRIPISFKDILFFSNKIEFKEGKSKIERIRTNYVGVISKESNQKLLLKCSLSELSLMLPSDFARINESYIINLQSDQLKGKANGNAVLLADKMLNISKRYKDSFNRKLNRIYLNI